MGHQSSMIALCDMESFYASCELIFRPDLHHRRVAVLSNNDGCVVACTKEALALGIKKFAPYFQQETLIKKQGVVVFSSNYTLYALVSRRIMAILNEEAPMAEVYSIDEAFLDLSGITDLNQFGQHLRRRVWREQRIPMGVGIAPTKTLAKLANKASKIYPSLNGVCVLDAKNKWQWLCQRLAVTDVWGVSKGLSSRLAKIGVATAAELSTISVSTARKVGGVVLARTVNELNGIPEIAFEVDAPDKKQIISSRSFGQKVTDIADLKRAVSMYATRACEKLRKQKSLLGTLTVFIKTSRHDSAQPYYCPAIHMVFDPPIDDTRKIAREAARLVESIFKEGFRYSKAGVIFSNISTKSLEQ